MHRLCFLQGIENKYVILHRDSHPGQFPYGSKQGVPRLGYPVSWLGWPIEGRWTGL
jgi:hypothetical protein